MSIVEEFKARHPPQGDSEQSPIPKSGRLAIMWVVIVALLVISIVTMDHLDGNGAEAAAKAGGPDALAWADVEDDNIGGFGVAFFWVGIGLLSSGAGRFKGIDFLGRRALIVATLAVVTTTAAMTMAAKAPTKGHYANSQGMGWVVGDTVMRREPWNQVSEAMISCRRWTAGMRTWARFSYNLRFADGTRAGLATDFDTADHPQPKAIAAWVDRMEPIDGAIRRVATVDEKPDTKAPSDSTSPGGVDEDCVALVQSELGGGKSARLFARMMRPSRRAP
jgi:hypothetical protein